MEMMIHSMGAIYFLVYLFFSENLSLCSAQIEARQEPFFGVYPNNDASSFLQAAFSQAGIKLGEGSLPNPPPTLGPTRKPSLFSPSRFLRLSRKKHRNIFPVMSPSPALPKPLKFDSGETFMQQMNLRPHPHPHPHPRHPHPPPHPPPQQYLRTTSAFNYPYKNDHYSNDRKALPVKPILNQVTLGYTTSLKPTRPPLPVVSERPKRLQVVEYSQRPRPESSRPSYQYGGFKPMQVLDFASSTLVTAAVPASEEVVNASKTVTATKRRSNYSEKPLTTSISKSLETWKSNSSQALDELRFHPAKISADNKIAVAINPSHLLTQLERVNGSERASVSVSVSTGVECVNKDLGWCDYSDKYPTHFVLATVKQCRELVDRMYVEVPQNLADFDDYVPFAPITNSSGQVGKERAAHVTWSWAGYRSKNKALCDSERKFVRPSIAQDITGRWFIVVQSSFYHQQVPIELCRNPGGICNNLGECGINARCVQRFYTQLLMSIDLDKENDCPAMRLYRFPSGCHCDAANYQ